MCGVEVCVKIEILITEPAKKLYQQGGNQRLAAWWGQKCEYVWVGSVGHPTQVQEGKVGI